MLFAKQIWLKKNSEECVWFKALPSFKYIYIYINLVEYEANHFEPHPASKLQAPVTEASTASRRWEP